MTEEVGVNETKNGVLDDGLSKYEKAGIFKVKIWLMED